MPEEEIQTPNPSQEEAETPEETTPAQVAGQPEETVPLKELQRVRKEAANYRSRLRKLEEESEAAKKQAELAKLEETERLRTIAAEAEAKVVALKQRSDTVAKRAAVIGEASRRRFINPSIVANVVNLATIDVDPDGVVDVEQVKLALDSLADSEPYMVQQDAPPAPPPANVGAGATNPRPPDYSVPIPVLIKPDEIAKMKDRSKQLMQEGRMQDAVKVYNRAWEMERDRAKK